MRWVDPSSLRLGEPAVSCFPVVADVLARVTNDMRERGYDEAEPIVVGAGSWPGAPLVLDGHTRLRAALSVGVDRVPVVEHKFSNAYEAIRYVIHRSKDRHARDDASIRRAVDTLDRLKPRGGDRRSEDARSGSKGSGGPFDRSADDTAAALGTSATKVKKARRVSKHADLAARVDRGEVSINAAAKQASERNRQAKAAAPSTTKPSRAAFTVDMWERMSVDDQSILIANGRAAKGRTLVQQKTQDIDWAKWSWNPVSGCLHSCPYCYARDIAAGMYRQGIYPYNFAPTLYPESLSAPSRTSLPAAVKDDPTWRNVFTCSMADLFGRWVPAGWIDAVLDVVRDNPQWNFLFLTKFPKRYAEFEFPDNAWVGTSVDCQVRVKAAEDALAAVNAKVKWLSIEPMLEPLKFSRLEVFNWVVIGGASASERTGKTPATPEWHVPAEWWGPLHTEAISKGIAVYHKSNLYERSKGTPMHNPIVDQSPKSFEYLSSKDRRTILEGEVHQ